MEINSGIDRPNKSKYILDTSNTFFVLTKDTFDTQCGLII
jgi:hypothetical protein